MSDPDRGPTPPPAEGGEAPGGRPPGATLAWWFLLPLLLFVAAHGVLSALASTSESSFATIGRVTHGAWWNVVVLCLFVWIPLAGTVAITARARADSARRTLVATFCGVVGLAFIAWHVWETSAQRVLGRRSLTDLFYDLAATLSGTTWNVPFASLGYLVGGAAVTTFLAFAAFDSWSDLRRERSGARGRKAVVTLIACIVYLVLAGTVIEYATGAAVP